MDNYQAERARLASLAASHVLSIVPDEEQETLDRLAEMASRFRVGWGPSDHKNRNTPEELGGIAQRRTKSLDAGNWLRGTGKEDGGGGAD